MALPQYDGNGIQVTKAVYYSGTDTLKEGYCLCYDVAATTTNADPKLRLGTKVIKPATANLMAFAGVVTASSAGKTGPCWVDIIVPTKGEICNVWGHVNATAFTSYLKLADADYGVVVDSSTAVNVTVGLAAATLDTSSTAALTKMRMV